MDRDFVDEPVRNAYPCCYINDGRDIIFGEHQLQKRQWVDGDPLPYKPLVGPIAEKSCGAGAAWVFQRDVTGSADTEYWGDLYENNPPVAEAEGHLIAYFTPDNVGAELRLPVADNQPMLPFNMRGSAHYLLEPLPKVLLLQGYLPDAEDLSYHMTAINIDGRVEDTFNPSDPVNGRWWVDRYWSMCQCWTNEQYPDEL